MKSVLVIDQSTSATKAVLFNSQGEQLDKASREHQQSYPQPGWVEHDAEEIWQNCLAVTNELLQRRRHSADNIVALAITNQRETIVVFDSRTGRPLCPAIVWQCRRGEALCDAQRQSGRELASRKKTGLPIDGYFSASKMQWLMLERPDIAAKLTCGEALVGTVDTYLIYRLTRGEVFATDHTNASRTLLYNIRELRWDEDCCHWWQVPRKALAQVRSSAERFGSTTLHGQLATPLPICGVMGDSQAALFAQGCFDRGTAKVTFGTGSSVLLNVGSLPPPAETGGAVSTIAWVLGGRTTYAVEGIITCAAATLTWMRDQLGIITSTDEVEVMAAEVSEAQEVYIVPAFSGLGAPHWRPAARAAIVGLSTHSDKRHLVRAALEAISFQLRDVLEMLEAETNVQLRELLADGGPTANPLLMQFTADIVGTNLRVPGHPDSSARGAAMMGALGIGLHSSIADLANLPGTLTSYVRKMPIAEVQTRYARWLRAVDQVICVA